MDDQPVAARSSPRGSRGPGRGRTRACRRRTGSASAGSSRGRCPRRWGGGCRPRRSGRGRRAAAPRSPGRPATCVARSPLKRAKRIEKLVSGTSGGVSAATFRNACESVTTRLGGRVRRAERLAQLALLDDQAMASRVQEVADGLHLRQDEPAPRALPCRWARPARPARPAPTRSPRMRRGCR